MPIDILETKKKPIYSISPDLRSYLSRFQRERDLPVSYCRLLQWSESMPLYDKNGEETLWNTVIYPREDMDQLNRALTEIYALLKTEGDLSYVDNLYVDRVDYCTFGNSNPFRVRIVNTHNENQDYYYIKKADASRVYGLELEHLLSPNRMHYYTNDDTLVEEHIVGIPGDIFIRDWLHNPNFKQVRLAKELVKFNERCFVRLLGDMRSYNFVVELTPDFEEIQIRLRAMDFDQQSYSGRKNFYLPQFFKDNNKLVTFCLKELDYQTSRQYQREEHAVIYRRIQLGLIRIKQIIECMCSDRIAPDENVAMLREALAEHYGNTDFLQCSSMGQLVRKSIETIYFSKGKK
ncbi:MAG: hypothetical protein JW739_07665 [Opitutales bacterium]|nr:hypothetical protein [Opitutales bacterium]